MMMMIRTTLLCLLGLGTLANGPAPELPQDGTRLEEKSWPVTDDAQTVSLQLPFGDLIRVEGWDRNEIAFKGVVRINGGALNDYVVFDYDEVGGDIRISMDYDQERLWQVTDSYDESLCEEEGGDSMTWYRDDNEEQRVFICKTIQYTLFVPRTMEVKVETINADVELRGTEGPLRVKAINGAIDMDWDKGDAGRFRFTSIHGELFSDVEGEFESQQQHVGFDYSLHLREGGPLVRLETINNHIYLRER